MKTLLVLRHAKSDWQQGQEDFERSLAPEGEAAASRISAYLRDEQLIPDLVLCSSATRARQTCTRVLAGLTGAPPVTWMDGLYLATLNKLITAVRAAADEAGTVMLVGHNPGLHQLAVALTHTDETEARNRLKEKLPTAGLAKIEFAVDRWQEVNHGTGRLVRFVVPQDLG